jgi:hypothetical protein
MSKDPFKSILGQILYIGLTARPDIITATSSVARFAQNPGETHWKALLRILRYLQGTRKLMLILGGPDSGVLLHAFADADWAGDIDKRRSRTGYVVYINSTPIIWVSKLQLSIALSSTEAEYISLSATARDVLWTRMLLQELGFQQKGPTVIYEDNKSCINIAQSRKAQPGVKHIDIREHFFRDKVSSNEIQLISKPTAEMTADLFTKQLPFNLFQKHRGALRLRLDSSL